MTRAAALARLAAVAGPARVLADRDHGQEDQRGDQHPVEDVLAVRDAGPSARRPRRPRRRRRQRSGALADHERDSSGVPVERFRDLVVARLAAERARRDDPRLARRRRRRRRAARRSARSARPSRRPRRRRPRRRSGRARARRGSRRAGSARPRRAGRTAASARSGRGRPRRSSRARARTRSGASGEKTGTCSRSPARAERASPRCALSAPRRVDELVPHGSAARRTSATAAIVASISSSPCASDGNRHSYWLGAT